jgi:molybdate transport system ATP-binding protein
MVLLARAVVKRPRLLILDEPCQGLDAAHRSAFLAAVDDLIGKGSVTAIYVTHRREEIPRAIQRVMRLRKGEISQLRPGRFGDVAAQVLDQQT